jgi:hypothetical protein
MVDPALQSTAVFALSLVFGGAALSKIAAWDELEGVVRNYRILPSASVLPVAWLLPPVELILAIGLLFPATRAPAALGMLALLLAFAGAIGVNVARGRTDIDCGCFSSSLKQNLSWWLVVRNAVLAGLALLAIAQAAPRELVSADWLTILAGGLTLFLAYLCVGTVTLKAPPRFDEIAMARAEAAAQPAQPRVSSSWKTL